MSFAKNWILACGGSFLDKRVANNKYGLALMIANAPEIELFKLKVNNMNAVIDLNATLGTMIKNSRAMEGIMALSELNIQLDFYNTHKENFIADMAGLGGERLQLVITHLFTPMNAQAETSEIPALPFQIVRWVRPELANNKFDLVVKVLQEGALACVEGATLDVNLFVDHVKTED